MSGQLQRFSSDANLLDIDIKIVALFSAPGISQLITVGRKGGMELKSYIVSLKPIVFIQTEHQTFSSDGQPEPG
jgi:hypothetical protein